MPRKLSSAIQTWGFRAGAILVALAGAYVFLWRPVPLSAVSGLPMLVWMIVLIFVGYRGFTLKEVALDGDHLVISHFGRQDRVPLSSIAAVTGGRGGKNPIKIAFRSPTEFGDSILFVPHPQRMWFWQRHPLVDELARLAGLPSRSL